MDDSNGSEYIPTEDDLQELEREYTGQGDTCEDDDLLQQIDFDNEQDLPDGLQQYVRKKKRSRYLGKSDTFYEKNLRTERVRKCKEEIAQWDADEIAHYGRIVLYDILTDDRKFRLYINPNIRERLNRSITKFRQENKRNIPTKSKKRAE